MSLKGNILNMFLPDEPISKELQMIETISDKSL